MLLRSTHAANEDLLPFELKGSLFTLTVLHLFRLDRPAIERYLAEKIKQAPSFFNNTPVVIDLEGLAEPKDGADLRGLYELLRGHGMIPVGIRNGGPKFQAAARLAGIPVLPESRASGANHTIEVLDYSAKYAGEIGPPKNPSRPPQGRHGPASSIIRCVRARKSTRRTAIW